MIKVKTFFDIFLNSLIPQVSFYKKIPKMAYKVTLWYFFFLIFILNLLFLITQSQHKEFKKIFMSRSIIENLNKYPKDLKIYINKGMLSTNNERPYLLWFDDEEKKELLLVIDEKANDAKIYEYGSYFLVNAKNIIFNQDKLKTKKSVFSLGNLNLIISKNDVNGAIKTFDRFFYPLLFLLLVIAIFVSPVLAFIFKLLIILVVSAITYLLYRVLYQKRNKFSKTFQVAVHSASLPITVGYIVAFLNPAFNFLAVFPLLLLIFSICGYYEAYVDHEASR